MYLKKNDRLHELRKYMDSTASPKYFGIESRIKKLYVPKLFNFDDLHNVAFGFDNTGYHFLQSFSQIAGAQATIFFVEENDTFMKCYGSAEFVNDASFKSEAMEGPTYWDTVDHVWTMYEQCEIDEADVGKITDKFSKLADHRFDLRKEPLPVGITKLSREYLDDS